MHNHAHAHECIHVIVFKYTYAYAYIYILRLCANAHRDRNVHQSGITYHVTRAICTSDAVAAIQTERV